MSFRKLKSLLWEFNLFRARFVSKEEREGTTLRSRIWRELGINLFAVAESEEQEPQRGMDVEPREYEDVKIDDNDVKKVLLGYLVHNCFKETAEAFVASTEMKCSSDFTMDIDKRKPVYDHVISGQALKAIELTNNIAPGLLAGNRNLHFDLLTIHFIELVRDKNALGALAFAQQELTPFGKEKCHVDKLQDCMALLAYTDPETSPLFSLLSEDYRQNIADTLNRALLDHANLPSFTSMERLIQQYTVVSQRLQQDVSGKDPSPAFTLKTFLR